MKKINIAVLLLSFFIYKTAKPIIVGSLTAPSNQPQITFPNSDTNNTALGFAFFEQGFILQNSTTTCTFNDFYPVSGLVNLSGGVLFLKRDFVYTNTAPNKVFAGGVIIGNNYSLEFPKALTEFGFPTSFLRVKDLNIVLNCDSALLSQLHCSGNCKISGRVKPLTFRSGSAIIVRPRSQLILENVEFKNVRGGAIRCLDDSASIIVRSCTFNLSGDYTFSRGSILFEEDNIITGTNKFNYTTRLTSSIASKSMLMFGLNTTFSYAPARANNNLLFMNDATSVLYLDGSTLISTRTGIKLSTGTMVIDNNVTLSSQAKFNAEALNIDTSLTLQVLGGGNLNLFGKVRYG